MPRTPRTRAARKIWPGKSPLATQVTAPQIAAASERRHDDVPIKTPAHWIGCGQKPASTCKRKADEPEGRVARLILTRAVIEIHFDDAGAGREHERLGELLFADRPKYRLDRAPPIRVEGTAEVGDIDVREAAEHPVDEPGRQGPAPGIFPAAPPPARHVAPGLDGGDELGEIGRRVLEICVHRDDDVPSSPHQPGVHGRMLTEIPLEPDTADVRIGIVEPLHDRPGPIRRAVVDQDHLVGAPDALERGDGLAVDLLERRFLVVDGDDE